MLIHNRHPDIAALLQLCQIRKYNRGAYVVKLGEPVTSLYYILEGGLLTEMSNAVNDRDSVHFCSHRGEFVNEDGMFVPTRNDIQVRTWKHSTVAEIPFAALSQAIAEKKVPSTLVVRLAHGVSRKLAQAMYRLNDVRFLHVHDRVLQTLQDLCGTASAVSHPDGVMLRITRKELAALSGCCREVAGKVLRQLAEEGFISANGKTIVVFNKRPT